MKPSQRFVAHPWHGVSPGEKAPLVVTCYVEIVPTDAVKYELDKETGLLRVDRPQKFSSVPPTLYGFIPRTYCAEQVAARAAERAKRPAMRGDGDPLDVCILTEKPFTHGDILVPALPVGGLRMLDGDEADDKIIAVMRGDSVYGALDDISKLPKPLVDRLRHYFLTYKQSPDAESPTVEIAEVYDRAEAFEVINRSFADYQLHYGE
jgi:inorganic pyrophosphatase